VFAPNHKLRSAITALAIGNVGKRRDAATDAHAVGGHAARGDAPGDCCGSCDQPRSHDTSRIAWVKLMARVGEEFPLECPWVRRRHPAQRRRPAGAGSLRTGGSQAGEGQDGFVRVKLAPDTLGRTARAAARVSRPRATRRLGRTRAGPLSTGNLSGTDRRAARDRHPQPLTAFHTMVQTAREKSGSKAGLRR
jgi:hypothetical protein